MATAVFVTYNSVGRALRDGAYTNSRNNSFVFQGFIRKDQSGPDLEEKQRTMIQLWGKVCRRVDLRKVDLFVIYCGKVPAVSILLAAGLPVNKICFVHCGCGNLEVPFLAELNLGAARWVTSECGGIDTLARIYEEFKSGGNVAAEMDLNAGLQAARELQQRKAAQAAEEDGKPKV